MLIPFSLAGISLLVFQVDEGKQEGLYSIEFCLGFFLVLLFPPWFSNNLQLEDPEDIHALRA